MIKIKFKSDEQNLPAPEKVHDAVIVDVVYYGNAEAYDKVRLVWEVAECRPSGKRFTVTKPYYDAVSLTRDLKPVLGHDLEGMKNVLEDPERLIGMPMRLQVVHNPSKQGIFPHVQELYPAGVVRLLPTVGYRRFTPPKVNEGMKEAA